MLLGFQPAAIGTVPSILVSVLQNFDGTGLLREAMLSAAVVDGFKLALSFKVPVSEAATNKQTLSYLRPDPQN